MAVLLLSSDLMIGSAIRGATDRLGQELFVTADVEVLLKRCDDNGKVVLLDLSTPGLNPQDLLPRLRSVSTPPRAVVAFGPHVHEQRLRAAAEAGCDEVLTRGQMHAQAEAVLARYVSAPPNR